MEQLLIKMARQLDALDEASLLALWDKYAVIVSHFEPTKRWEEAALVFSFIQAKRWKNQLFNYSWSAQVHPGAASQPVAWSRTFFWTRQRAGLLLRSPSAKPRLSSSARTAVQRRMPPKSPAEKAEAAGKPFFPPDSR